MLNGPTDPVLTPLVAVMVMSSVTPASPAPGVPVKEPVLESKLAQDGIPSIAKLTEPLEDDTAGWKK